MNLASEALQGRVVNQDSQGNDRGRPRRVHNAPLATIAVWQKREHLCADPM